MCEDARRIDGLKRGTIGEALVRDTVSVSDGAVKFLLGSTTTILLTLASSSIPKMFWFTVEEIPLSSPFAPRRYEPEP